MDDAAGEMPEDDPWAALWMSVRIRRSPLQTWTGLHSSSDGVVVVVARERSPVTVVTGAERRRSG